MTTKSNKIKKYFKKVQNLSETQKIFVAIFGTILMIVIIFTVVNFLNNLIISQ